MMDTKAILRQNQLRSTESRLAILKIFDSQSAALTERELEQSLGRTCDRVTIYRTLSTFLEKGILHKVLDDSGSMRYALCVSHCKEGVTHPHDHVHFKCTICGQTTCIEQVPIPEVQLPEGFQLKEVNVLLTGNCPKCQK
ncbi:MAG: Fur family transcriptional regulator [Bacteroidota bacterium]